MPPNARRRFRVTPIRKCSGSIHNGPAGSTARLPDASLWGPFVRFPDGRPQKAPEKPFELTASNWLREELNLLLGPEDERCYRFGIDRPVDPETPEMPENLTTIPGAPGSRT